MGSLLRDLHYGIRMLLKHPGLTTAALLCLGLGIGSTITMFTMVNAMLIRPLPYDEPDRIIWLMETAPKRGADWLSVSYPNFHDWQQQSTSFEYLAAYHYESLSLADGQEPRRLQALVTSADLFRVLGVEPYQGRSFIPDDDVEGAERVAIISYGLWQSQFGGDPEMVGRVVNLHGDPHTVIGIMPAQFQYPEFTELWVPISRFGGLNYRGWHSLQAVGRLKDGLSIDQARAEMETIVNGLMEAYPDDNDDIGIRLVPLVQFVTGDFKDQFQMLMVAVGLVLLIACANVANLLLARATGRSREIAIRRTLGAARPRLIRQLLTESILLGLAGGIIGLVLGKVGVDLTLAIVPVDIPFWINFTIDWRVIVFLVFVSIVTGLIFGMAPISQASRTNLTDALKEGGARSVGTSRHILRNILVIGEVALALVLLVGAGLLIQGFLRLQDVVPGFEAERVLAMHISLPDSQYPEDEQREFFFRQALERLEALPGVVGSGASLSIPMGGSSWGNGYSVEDFPPDPQEPLQIGNVRAVHGDYFGVMQISLLSGRVFTTQEISQGGDVVIINETFARRYWPEASPLGKRMTLGRGISEDTRWFEIVGMVGDVRHYGLGNEIRPGFYFPFANYSNSSMYLVVRTAADPAAMARPVREAIWSIDDTLPVHNLRPMEEIVAESTWGELIFTRMLSAFALIAFVLAMLGVYGVMSYAVTERTREIGIRMAIGAHPAGVIRLIVRQGMMLVVLGMAIGLAGAIGVGAVMATIFYGVSAFEPAPLAGMVLLLSLVALLANYVPARRAAKCDPVSALRYE